MVVCWRDVAVDGAGPVAELVRELLVSAAKRFAIEGADSDALVASARAIVPSSVVLDEIQVTAISRACASMRVLVSASEVQ